MHPLSHFEDAEMSFKQCGGVLKTFQRENLAKVSLGSTLKWAILNLEGCVIHERFEKRKCL